MIRKKGKLPNGRTFSVKYGLEYGKDELEMKYIPQHDLGTCVIVDDVLALIGTITEDLCKLHGLEVTDKLCLLDLFYKGYDVKSLISYE